MPHIQYPSAGPLDGTNNTTQCNLSALVPYYNKTWTTPVTNAPTERGIDQDSIVELGRCCGNMDGLHLLETAEGMTLGDELGDGALMQRASDQQHNVVYHVAVSKTHKHSQNDYYLMTRQLIIMSITLHQFHINYKQFQLHLKIPIPNRNNSL